MSNINHPSHYNDGKIEVIEYIEDKGFNFNLGNAIKYISRAGKKCGNSITQDLEKAIWYLNRELRRISINDDKLKLGSDNTCVDDIRCTDSIPDRT